MTLFVTGTGTDVGKTYASVSLLRAWLRRGLQPAAVKPFETGCDPHPADAEALAHACGRPELAHLPGLYRARLPAAPYAATLEGEPPPDWERVLEAVSALPDRPLLVEGAGGPLVPVDASRYVIDLAVALEAEVLLVAPDRLGVLSDTLSAAEVIRARGLKLRAVLLTRPTPALDPAAATNARILRAHLPEPVFLLAHGETDLTDLAASLDA